MKLLKGIIEVPARSDERSLILDSSLSAVKEILEVFTTAKLKTGVISTTIEHFHDLSSKNYAVNPKTSERAVNDVKKIIMSWLQNIRDGEIRPDVRTACEVLKVGFRKICYIYLANR